MQGPREDPLARQARERERQIAMRERSTATEELAAGMTADLQRFYATPRYSMFAR